MNTKTVIFCGGGTAGHLYPALTLAAELKKKSPGMLRTLFIGTGRPVEREILEKSQEEYLTLKMGGLKQKGISALKSMVLLPGAFWKSFRILKKIKPDLVVGMGGYSSGPVLLAASWMKIPTLIMEQNVKPGFTNRMLRPWADKAVVAFEESLPEFKGKGVFLGNPIREEFYDSASKTDDGRLSILIFGGSQGSHFINSQVAEALPRLKKYKNKIRVHHQTGPGDLSWMQDSYRRHGFDNAGVVSFHHDMPKKFQQSDLAVCRAGATTVAELIASRKPALLIPFAEASDNHQEYNARVLEKAGGARILREENFTAESFAGTIIDFIQHPDKLARMEQNLNRLRIQNPAERIADLCFKLMSGNHRKELRLW